MTLEELIEKYRRPSIRILSYLRKVSDEKKFVHTEELIEKLDKSKFTISYNVRVLYNDKLISKEYVKNSNPRGSRLRISITEKGLNLLKKILKEILRDGELKNLKLFKANIK